MLSLSSALCFGNGVAVATGRNRWRDPERHLGAALDGQYTYK